MWGVHNEDPSIDFVAGGFVAIGSYLPGDLSGVAGDREALKAALSRELPDAKPRSIAGWAGILMRFADSMQVGDLVVHPVKSESTVAIGRITGPYTYLGEQVVKAHRRPVEWIKVGIPRTEFSQGALYEIGSLLAVFGVRTHCEEFLRAVDAGTGTSATTVVEEAYALDEVAAKVDEPSAARIEQATQDFVVRTIHAELGGFEFEHLVAAILRAMGYEARVTQATGDGGVDVLASRDRLGLEPPLIKVQCKRTTNTIGGPEVQALVGTLAHGGNERALFVTLGGFSPSARQIAAHRHDVRLIGAEELVLLLLEHYDALPARYRRMLPVRQVYVVDQELE